MGSDKQRKPGCVKLPKSRESVAKTSQVFLKLFRGSFIGKYVMADGVVLKWNQAEKRYKFEPNEDYLDQLLAMGISLNGAKKALYHTGNRGVTFATNWIFDHPELDLETPVEEEIKRQEAEEEEYLAGLEGEEDSDDDVIRMYYQQHSHVHAHGHDPNGCLDVEDLDEEDIDEEEEEFMMNGHHYAMGHQGHYYHGSDETDSDSEDFPEFKMVFVVNTSLEMGPSKTAAQVAQAALGLQNVVSMNDEYKVYGSSDLLGEETVVFKGESTQHLKDLYLMAEDLDLACYLVKSVEITQLPNGSVTVFGVYGDEVDINKITGRLKSL